jgi:hypothetical protein
MPNVNARACTHVAADGSMVKSENCSVEPERYWEGLHVVGTFMAKDPGGEWEPLDARELTLPLTGTVVQWK